jgi:hypothetical protein
MLKTLSITLTKRLALVVQNLNCVLRTCYLQHCVDTGYFSVVKFHVNFVIPVERSKKKTFKQGVYKVFNHRVSSLRVLNEHVVGLVKRFKIVSDRYCNRRKRYDLRFNLIAGICNYKQKT